MTGSSLHMLATQTELTLTVMQTRPYRIPRHVGGNAAFSKLRADHPGGLTKVEDMYLSQASPTNHSREPL